MTNHAIDRASERYGLHLHYSDLNKIIKIITSGKSIYSYKSEVDFRVFHVVRYKNKTLKVLYQKGTNEPKRKQKIITIYPFGLENLREIKC